MMTRRASTLVLVSVSIVAATAFAAEQASTPAARDGKTIFLENKCNSCHSVQTLKIEKKQGAEEEKSVDKDDKVKPPDLSSVGLERKADWMAKFLLKKEMIDGKKHRKLFKGSEADLKTLTTWLETQKAPKKKGAK
jgi:cbb3-type cytochrome oxidase cytochrome c subunit